MEASTTVTVAVTAAKGEAALELVEKVLLLLLLLVLRVLLLLLGVVWIIAEIVPLAQF